MKLLISYLIFAALIFSACKEEGIDPVDVKADFPKGIFVVNEGAFQNGTGTITYFNKERKETWQEVFQDVNERPLGNVVQSMAIYNDKAYIVVNNAGKTEVVTLEDFRSAGTIEGLVLPRHFLGISENKGYISQWGAGGLKGSVEAVDLENLSITKSIGTGAGADFMMMHNGQVLVLNSGGFGNDSTMSIIDLAADAVVKTIVLQPNPKGIVVDKNGKLWVLCGGKYDFMDPNNDSPGHLLRLHPETFSIELDLEFPAQSIHPEKLLINTKGDRMYFLYGSGIYTHSIEETTLALEPFVKRTFYSIGYDSDDEAILAADAVDFVSKGWVIRYLESGNAIDSFKAGVLPGNFTFSN